MGTAKVVHSYAAIIFTLSVLARIIWMFIGNRYASWKQFIPLSRRRRRGLLPTLAFYLFLRRDPPTFIGHNPLAGATYTIVFLVYLTMIATGFALYSIGAPVDSHMRIFAALLPLFGGAQSGALDPPRRDVAAARVRGAPRLQRGHDGNGREEGDTGVDLFRLQVLHPRRPPGHSLGEPREEG